MAESSHNWDEAGSDGRQDLEGAKCAGMKPLAPLIAGLAVVAGCQRSTGTAAAAASGPYRADIVRLCDVVVQSGADRLPEGERLLAIVQWLPAHLETQEAHEFLARIQPLEGEAKARALDTEARRVGLPGCALAAAWRTDEPGH
jgi:hypothetical protein